MRKGSSPDNPLRLIKLLSIEPCDALQTCLRKGSSLDNPVRLTKFLSGKPCDAVQTCLQKWSSKKAGQLRSGCRRVWVNQMRKGSSLDNPLPVTKLLSIEPCDAVQICLQKRSSKKAGQPRSGCRRVWVNQMQKGSSLDNPLPLTKLLSIEPCHALQTCLQKRGY